MNLDSKQVFLVVLYKSSLDNSRTIQSIQSFFTTESLDCYSRFELLIWDNSPESHAHEAVELGQKIPINVKLIHTPQNTSLSKIYNYVSCKLQENDYLTLFDQDTTLPASYFEELKIAQINQWPLILPKVECQGVLVSPGSRFFARGKRLKGISSGALDSKNLLAINSGMSIIGKVFCSYKYDERLRFYGTDTFFMRNYEKYFDKAFVLNTPISHSLAVMEQRSDEWRSAYLEELIYTNKITFKNSFWEKAFTMIYTLVMRLKFFLGYYR
jgi:hypothetical protein